MNLNGNVNIETFCLGAWQTNCYVVSMRGHDRCWIVDAGYEAEPMVESIRRRGLSPTRLILTHAHLDHIAGIDTVRHIWPNLPITIHETEADFLGDPQQNLSVMVGELIHAPAADEFIAHGQSLTLGDATFEVRHTPGHSPGGITLYEPREEVAIVGDTLFAGSIGRHDFPHSDGPTLMRSIHEQLLTLPDATRILPGHGPATTIRDERMRNPYLR